MTDNSAALILTLVCGLTAAYLARQYKTIAIVGAVLALLIGPASLSAALYPLALGAVSTIGCFFLTSSPS